MCQPIPNRIIAMAKPHYDPADAEAYLAEHGIEASVVTTLRDALSEVIEGDYDANVEFEAIQLELSPTQTVRAITQLVLDPDVIYAEPDSLVAGTLASIDGTDLTLDPKLLANYQAILVQRDSSRQGAGVTLAVLDSGIEPSVLGGNPPLAQYDFTRVPTVVSTIGDEYGHGTLMAKLIREVAPQVDLVSYRILDHTGQGSLFGVLAGFVASAVRSDVFVVNASFAIGMPGAYCEECGYPAVVNGGRIGQTLDIARFHLEQVTQCPIVIAAAGNQKSSLEFPALLESSLPIGAVDSQYRKATYFVTDMQQTIGRPFLVAPGGDASRQAITVESLGTLMEQGQTPNAIFGTSVAAAYASSVIALYLADGVDIEDVISTVVGNAYKPPNYSWAAHGDGVIRFR